MLSKGWRWYRDRAEAIRRRIQKGQETLEFYAPGRKATIRRHNEAIDKISRALWRASDDRGYKKAYEIALKYERKLR